MSKRLGIVADNSEEYIRILLQIWNEGNCAVLVDKRITANCVEDMLLMANVEECFTDRDDLNLIKGIKMNQIRGQQQKAIEVKKEIYELFCEKYTENEAVVLFSSGTTGKAKGICLSHKAISTNADAVIEYMQPQNSTMYIVKTLSHSSTLVGELLVALKTKARVIISPTIISPTLAINNMIKFGVDILCLNPSLLYLYSLVAEKQRVECVKKIYTSGSSVRSEVIDIAIIGFLNATILNVYGLTEAGPRVTAQRIYQENNGLVSVGMPIKNVEVKVVDKEYGEVKKGTNGVVHVKTPSHFLYYLNGVPERESYLTGWFNTGDVGHWDEKGNLYIVGREDNMILSSSHNVYPEEIEKVIESFVGIKEALVFGIEDKLAGERIICLYQAEGNMDELLRKKCLDNMATYEVPKEYIRVEEIIHTANGKKDRIWGKVFYSKTK